MPLITDIASDIEALANTIARFPAGQSVDVPAYLEEHGNPEAAQAWRDMNEEHGDKFKKQTSQGEVMAATGDKAEYTEYFKKKMKEHGLDGIEGVDDAKLKKFYEDVDRGWKADKESSDQDIPGRLASLADAMRSHRG